HCSPISDTTILSSAGAGCHHIDHVMTQLPYALTAAGVAGAGFLVLGVTDNTWLGFAAMLVILGFMFYFLKRNTSIRTEEREAAEGESS
ncbi:MAG TPA: Na+/H+ antiporter NhaC family protein, partial [Pseudogracilibacillus sp.]|nr:Na+/H+ antiporter NhaC family protein [Pseudogracilibacillus sp.]